MNKSPLINTNFITNIRSPGEVKPTVPKRRTYRGNYFIPNISNYYKQSANNSKKIRSLDKKFEKIVENAENKFRNVNMKQKLKNEMKQIENNEIKRKAGRTNKQINNEMRQEKEEQNEIEREEREREVEVNKFRNYPTMKYYGKGKVPTSENLIKFMMKNPKNKITTNLTNKYGNQTGQKGTGTLAISYGTKNNEPNAKARHEYNQIKNKPLYNESQNIFKKTYKKRIEKKRRRMNL
jgi:hypothetical protein